MPTVMADTELKLILYGPYGLCGKHERIIFYEPIGEETGIYFWTVPYVQGGSIINYIGETGESFKRRFKDHMIHKAGGNYRICDPDFAVQGVERILWNGLWRKGTRDKMPEFVSRITELSPAIKKSLEHSEIYVAPFEGEKRIRQRIEGAIADYIKAQTSPASGLFPTDIRYTKRWNDEEPLHVRISGGDALLGMPKDLLA
jgi:hypothetical protein